MGCCALGQGWWWRSLGATKRADKIGVEKRSLERRRSSVQSTLEARKRTLIVAKTERKTERVRWVLSAVVAERGTPPLGRFGWEKRDTVCVGVRLGESVDGGNGA